ncbi:MAG: hypothetical protein ACLQG3_02755 [Terracidiphilus sp.]
MDDQGSLIVRPRDYSDIASLQNPTVLEDFLDEPLTLIAETITGALAVGKTGVMVAGGRIVQALLKGQLFKQWAREFRTLRDAGKIPDDFAEKKYGFQTWVELMTTIDEESPDADRLEALKAMFYAVNKVNAEDKDRVTAYQLWRITKQLNSGDLLLLKCFGEHDHRFGDMIYENWISQMTNLSGFGAIELVQLHVDRLLELRLLHEPQRSHNRKIAEITSLGRRLCANINTYHVDLNSVVSRESSA